MALKVPNQRSRSNDSNSGAETIAVRLTSVTANEKAPSYENDFFTGILLHNAMGMDVENSRDENFVSTVEVKVKLREPTFKFTADNAPYSVVDLLEGGIKGNAKPMGKNPIIVLEKAWIDNKTGFVSAGWVRIGANDSAPSVADGKGLTGMLGHALVDEWTQVFKEKTVKDFETKEDKQQQQSRVFLTNYAERIIGGVDGEGNNKTAMDVFYEKAGSWLLQSPEVGGGKPSVMLRITQFSNPQTVMTTFVRPTYTGEGEARVVDHPHDSLTKWLEAEYNEDKDPAKDSNWKAFIEMIDNEPDYCIEMVPVWTYNTGRKSLPSAKAASQKKPREANHVAFTSYILEADGTPVVSKDSNDNETQVMGQLITKAHTMLRRKFERDNVTPRPWSASDYVTVKGNRGMFHQIDDLPTAVTPPEMLARFTAQAERRRAMHDAAWQASMAAKNGNQQSAPAADDAKPDDTNGLAAPGFSHT